MFPIMIGLAIGAAMGGGIAALRGGKTDDILKGALLGGATGAVGGGISSLMPAATAGTIGSAAANVAPSTIMAGTEASAISPAVAGQSSAITNLLPVGSAPVSGGVSVTPTIANPALTQGITSQVAKPVDAGFFGSGFGKFVSDNKMPLGLGAAGLLMANKSGSNQSSQPESDSYIRPYEYSQVENPDYKGAGTPYFKQSYIAKPPIKAKDFGTTTVANGGIIRMAEGGETTQEQRESTANPTLEALAAIQQARQTYQPPTVLQGITQPLIQPQMAQIQQQYAGPQRQAPADFQYQAPQFVQYGFNTGGGGGGGVSNLIDPVTGQPVKSPAAIAAAIAAAKNPGNSGGGGGGGGDGGGGGGNDVGSGGGDDGGFGPGPGDTATSDDASLGQAMAAAEAAAAVAAAEAAMAEAQDAEDASLGQAMAAAEAAAAVAAAEAAMSDAQNAEDASLGQAMGEAAAAAAAAAGEAASAAAAAAAASDGSGMGEGGGGSDGGDGGGGGCVDPSVLVLMADSSYKTAGEIKIGDFVYAPHQDTLEYGNFEVLAADIITQPKLLIKFEDNSTIKVSDTHKFLMSDAGWKQMLHIKLGDIVQGQVVNKRIIGMEYIGEGSVVRLNIDQAHTYISDGLVSHNEKKEGGLIRRRYALGGNIHDLMQRYAMGGGIGAYYAGPDDGNRNFGGIESLNQGPQYPMQGIGYAMGGHLGGYSDGGQLLKGPGDGVSDDIPAQIGARQPARLADGEFVIPARIVSELGNGSTDAGAKRLYAMMDRIQKNRGKTVGKGKVAVNSKSSKYLPA